MRGSHWLRSLVSLESFRVGVSIGRLNITRVLLHTFDVANPKVLLHTELLSLFFI